MLVIDGIISKDLMGEEGKGGVRHQGRTWESYLAAKVRSEDSRQMHGDVTRKPCCVVIETMTNWTTFLPNSLQGTDTSLST